MKINFDQLKSVTFGAVDIFNDEEGYTHWHRLTTGQMETFAALSPNFIRRTHFTAGCRLDFHTNSRHVLLQTAAEGCYEVLVNGLNALCIRDTSRYTLELPEGDTRITVLLPANSPGVLRMLHLDENSYFRPHTYDRKFLFLGDSITQGSQSSRPSTCYANRLADFYNAQVLNWGVGGSYFGAQTVISTDYDPDTVFIAYGTNDYTHWDSVESFRTACTDYFDRVQALYPGKKIICISPIWRADGDLLRPTGNLEQVRQFIIKQALARDFIHIDGMQLVPHAPDYYQDQFLHPNDLGFSIYAQKMIQFLNDII